MAALSVVCLRRYLVSACVITTVLSRTAHHPRQPSHTPPHYVTRHLTTWDSLECEQNSGAPNHVPLVRVFASTFLIHARAKWGAERGSADDQRQLLDECHALVASLSTGSGAGGDNVCRVVHTHCVQSQCVHSATVLGPGQLETARAAICEYNTGHAHRPITCVLLNCARLTHTQRSRLQLNLCQLPVMDRYQLVLALFRLHASSQAARLSVALAELPTLRETMIAERRYTDQARVLWEQRRMRIERELGVVERQTLRAVERRQRTSVPSVGVVGYTNCGKSTLIGRLSGSRRAIGQNRLFATLDVTAHRMSHRVWRGAQESVESRDGSLASCVFLDTVGFMHCLPRTLAPCFRTTLSQVFDAQLILILVDLSDGWWQKRLAHVEQTLLSYARASSDAVTAERLVTAAIRVGTKCDLVTNASADCSTRLSHVISSRDGSGLCDLRAHIQRHLVDTLHYERHEMTVTVGGPVYAWLRRHCVVVRETLDERVGAVCHLTVLLTAAQLAQLNRCHPPARRVHVS